MLRGAADSEDLVVHVRWGAAIQQGFLDFIEPLVQREYQRFEAADQAVENEEEHQRAVALRVVLQGAVPIAGLLQRRARHRVQGEQVPSGKHGAH
jgi:hypothetical protein